MPHSLENKIVLVTRPTRLDDLVVRYNSQDQAKFYIEHMGGDFSDYVLEHERYQAAKQAAEAALANLGRLQLLDRAFLPNFLFGPHDTVVTLGQDGLVVNTAKYVSGQPIVGVNPDPARWDGVLLPFRVGDLSTVIPDVWRDKRPVREATMASAQLNNGLRLRAVNDLFIGPRSHGSARYRIQLGQHQEQQSSSGIIISTGLGSTGWLTSILAGAKGVVDAVMGTNITTDIRTPADANYLYFSVREPFPSKTSNTSTVFGRITPDRPLIVTSLMPENGVIFSDGLEKDFLEFNAGAVATISLAEQRVRLVQ